MKMRWSLPAFIVTVLLVLTAFLFLKGPIDNNVSAQQTAPEIAPSGGGKFESAPSDSITDAQRSEIQSAIHQNIAKLQNEGRLAAARPEVVALSWPIRKAAGLPDFNVDAIANYVDQNPAYPNQLLDWNCGARTYDLSSGYNHAGVDIYTWPFSWKKLDDNSVEIVAAAAGTIILKSDGNFDRNCAFNNGNPNAVYVRQADNSVAWYLHMKSGSLTSKLVGDTVAVGERLGVVGSSGSSTGPHLHFELYNAANQLQDTFQGACNSLNPFTWWAVQEPYRNPRINTLMTHSNGPVFPTCPAAETPNEKTVFQPGETVLTGAYYRDQMLGQQTQYALLRPDGSTFVSWSHTSPDTYDSSYWLFNWTLPSNGPTGVWKFRATFNSTTYDRLFNVGPVSQFASVSGRVLTADGRGLRSAIVSITDSLGAKRTVSTNLFGIYTIDNVRTGAAYTISVSSKRFRFASAAVQVNGNLTSVDFAGIE